MNQIGLFDPSHSHVTDMIVDNKEMMSRLEAGLHGLTPCPWLWDIQLDLIRPFLRRLNELHENTLLRIAFKSLKNVWIDWKLRKKSAVVVDPVTTSAKEEPVPTSAKEDPVATSAKKKKGSLATSAKKKKEPDATSAKKKREPNAYNLFMKAEIPRLKTERPDLTQKERLSLAASNWKNVKPQRMVFMDGPPPPGGWPCPYMY